MQNENLKEGISQYLFFQKLMRIESMIHHSSTAPVLIKKINLKIWSLRDEIEARITKELEINPESNLYVEQLRSDYLGLKNETPNNVLALNPDAESTPPVENEPPQEDASIISIDRTLPEISAEKISRGKAVLAEIHMDKMFLFSNCSYTEGQSIVIQFCIPKMFMINADVVYCRPFNLKSRIISENNYNYRVLIKFSFIRNGERAILRQFIQSIEPDVQKIEKKPETALEEEDSGFGELDDLL